MSASSAVSKAVVRRFSTGTLQSIKQTVYEGPETQSKVEGRVKALILAFGGAGVGMSCISTMNMYGSDTPQNCKAFWNKDRK